MAKNEGWAALGWAAWRGVAMLCTTLSFFMAMRYLPQSEATAINFLAPMLVLVSAPSLH